MSNVKMRPRYFSLGQAWRGGFENGFRPGEVCVTSEGDGLVIEALLEDDDIFNPERRSHEPFFRQGDVFETFLRPENQSAYTELHVGPDNQTFHLRIPSASIFAAQRSDPEAWRPWLVTEPCFRSQVAVERERARWRVQLVIPFSAISPVPVQPGDRWLCSFSRYDYTRGKAEPVLSSSSPHAELDFHRQQEWASLIFEDGAAL